MTLPSTKTASVDGEELTETQVFSNTQTPEKASVNDVPVLRRAAMDCLARREHSFYELQQKLTKKFPDTDPELLHTIADKLRVEGLQSDARFAESYVRYRKSRGFAETPCRRRQRLLINLHGIVYTCRFVTTQKPSYAVH
jgi:SOS response regulatory protein OraA/RecX